MNLNVVCNFVDEVYERDLECMIFIKYVVYYFFVDICIKILVSEWMLKRVMFGFVMYDRGVMLGLVGK